jgi:hypothetical protein
MYRFTHAAASRRSVTTFTILIAAALLLACGSKELNRSRAADLIRSSDGFQKPVAITLSPQYDQSVALVGTGSETTPKDEFALRRFFESRPDLAVLNHLGLAEFKVTNIQYPNSASSPVAVAATLTDAGRSASKDWQQQSGGGWEIPVTRRELVEVTGLAGGEGESRTATVEYTWRWQPVGLGTYFDTASADYRKLPDSLRRPSGQSFADVLRNVGRVTFFDSSTVQKDTATLRLYDDGWRIDEKAR